MDPTGAAVPGALVHADNVDTNVRTTLTSLPDGGFTFSSLAPGNYQLTVEAAGFKKGVASNVIVHIGDIARADIQLQVGNVSESVEVVGSAVLVTPDSATAGTVMTSKEYDTLPLAASSRARIPTDFALLTPGVLGGQQRPGGSVSATTSLSVDGSQQMRTDILVDGMSAGQVGQFGSFTELAVPVDAVQEFNLMKGAFSAEYGYVQTAVVSFSLKSGTNQFHGSLFENFRNDVLNSRSFFEGDKLPFRHNNFGGTFLGPIWIPKVYNGRDRTFFMVSSDNSIFRGASQIRLYTSPTPEFLNGDFSNLRTATGAPRIIYDPATTVVDASGAAARQPFAGNIIPRARMSRIAQQVAALIPPPNRPGQDANFLGRGGAAIFDNTFFNTKIDHHFNEKHSLSWSFNYTQLPRESYDNPYEHTPLLTGLNQNIGSKNSRLAYDWVINPGTLNHLQIGFNRFVNGSASYSKGEGWPEKLGLTGVGGDGSMPVFAFSSDNYPKMALERWDSDVEENIMLRNNTTFIRGKHNLKVGVEVRQQRWKPRRWRNQAGTFNFSFRETALNGNSNTGNSFASFLLGYVDTANISTPLHVSSARPYYAGYVQDDLKLTPRLTLNLGLRYDLDLPPYEQYDRASTFDLDTPNPAAGNRPGALVFLGEGPGRYGSRTYEETYYKAFNPRFGLAYQLQRATVLRLGYGVSHSSHSLFNDHMGFSTTQNFDTLDQGNTPAFLLDNGMPTNWPKPPFLNPAFGNNNNVSAAIRDDSGRMPITQNWRLDIQRELPGGTVLEVAYVGTRATHQVASLRNVNQVDARYLSLGTVLNANINSAAAVQAGIPVPYPGFSGTVRQALRPYPQVLTVSTRQDKLGSSSYHSFQTKIQKRFASGLQYLVSYTFSKSMTDIPSSLEQLPGSQIQDAGNRRVEWAIAPFDTPQNLWISAIYELPFGTGKPFLNQNALARHLLGDWSISAVVNYQSGLPLRPTQNNRLLLFNSSQRPDLILGQEIRNEITYNDFDPAVHRLFNPTAFADPGTARFGNAAPRLSNARGFGIRKEDLAVRKNMRFTESLRLEFNVQIFNMLNRPQWGLANDNVSSSDFGKVTAAGPGRFVQLGLKLHF
jgi:outer membrane receptor protein involved in Fe transport